MKKIYYWSSWGYKVLSAVLFSFFISMTILLTGWRDSPKDRIGALIAGGIVCLYFGFALFLSFYVRIVINEDKRIMKFRFFFRNANINFENIRDIEIDVKNSLDEKKYCFVWIRVFKGKDFRLPEYARLFKKCKSVELTCKKVEELKQYLKI